jgi:uncharacterized protein
MNTTHPALRMVRNMENPFQYGGTVSGPAFCNRVRELADLARAANNGEKLFIYSERRMGKTSLVLHVLRSLARKEYASAYVDLWPTDGESSFATAVAKGVSESMSTTADQLLKTAREFFGYLAPSVTLDEEGKPRLSFGVSRGSRQVPNLEQVLATPVTIGRRRKRKVVVVFDEIQRILEYESDSVERRLRSIVQRQEGISYIFLGSRKHLVQKMFLERSRPLYRAAGHYPLGPIRTEDWVPFIQHKFRTSGKQIHAETTRSVCELTEGHPFYTQQLCHVLWERCEQGQEVHRESLRSAVKVLLDRESYAYSALWDSLTLGQRRLLTGLALAERGAKVFSGSFVQRYQVGTPSSAQRAAETLMSRDLIDRDNGSFVIADRFFRLWVRQMTIQ